MEEEIWRMFEKLNLWKMAGLYFQALVTMISDRVFMILFHASLSLADEEAEKHTWFVSFHIVKHTILFLLENGRILQHDQSAC